MQNIYLTLTQAEIDQLDYDLHNEILDQKTTQKHFLANRYKANEPYFEKRNEMVRSQEPVRQAKSKSQDLTLEDTTESLSDALKDLQDLGVQFDPSDRQALKSLSKKYKSNKEIYLKLNEANELYKRANRNGNQRTLEEIRRRTDMHEIELLFEDEDFTSEEINKGD